MKTPRFLVAACISLALAFTFSCSSDSSDDPLPVQSSSSDGGGSSSSGGGGSSSSGGGGSSSSDDGGGSSSSDAVASSSSSVPVAQHTLTINVDPTAGGTVLRNPAKTSYDHGTEVIVTAEPENGYAFAGWWSGETLVEEAIEYAVEMDGDKTLTAKFELIPPGSYSLEIHVNDVHGGTVRHEPSGTIHVSGTVVTVTAEPEDGYEFTGWSGAANSIANPIEITMDEDKELTANFAQLMSGSFTDPRDDQPYEWVRIINVGGAAYNKIWMAQNLNYNADGSKCYDNSESNCETYGRLYNWATAMANSASSSANPSGVQGVCPLGWHLPSDAEWIALMIAVGSDDKGTKLKATVGWNSSGNGTDDFGFSALPGGYGAGNNFYNVGDNGYWWSSTESFSTYVNYWLMGYNSSIVFGYSDGNKTRLYSVRCVLD